MTGYVLIGLGIVALFAGVSLLLKGIKKERQRSCFLGLPMKQL